MGALLKNYRTIIGTAQLIPANACHDAIWACTSRHRLISYQRFVIAKVAIGKPKQRPLSLQKVDFLCGIGLWNTCAAATAWGEDRIKSIRRQGVSQGERRICRSNRVVMELIKIQRILWRTGVVILRAHKEVGTTNRWRCHTIKGAWQQTITHHICRGRRYNVTNHRRVGITSERLNAIQSIRADALKRTACTTLKLSCAEIIRIGPHTTFGIVREIVSIEIRAGGDGPTIVAPSGIIRSEEHTSELQS